jgi:hypothetical protein
MLQVSRKLYDTGWNVINSCDRFVVWDSRELLVFHAKEIWL